MIEKVGHLILNIILDFIKYRILYLIGSILLIINLGFLLIPIESIFSFFMQEETYHFLNQIGWIIIGFLDLFYLFNFLYIHAYADHENY